MLHFKSEFLNIILYIMEQWIYFAFVAAFFISIRDFLTRDIIRKYSYVNYILFANILVFIGTLSYIIVFNKKIIRPSNEDFWKIFIRLIIVYVIVEPCIFYAIKYCENPSYANSIIGLNTIFIFIASIFILKEKLSWIKGFGLLLSIIGSYLIIN